MSTTQNWHKLTVKDLNVVRDTAVAWRLDVHEREIHVHDVVSDIRLKEPPTVSASGIKTNFLTFIKQYSPLLNLLGSRISREVRMFW